MSDQPTWVKVLGVGALALGAVGLVALAASSSGEQSGTIPPDDIEEDDDQDDDDDDDDDEGLPVNPETIPGVLSR